MLALIQLSDLETKVKSLYPFMRRVAAAVMVMTHAGAFAASDDGALAPVGSILVAATPANGFITRNESGMDTIFSQAGFGISSIDIRFSANQSIFNSSLLVLDEEADFATLAGLNSIPSPSVNIYFVDHIEWCGGLAPGIIGCGYQPGNLIIVDSSWAANPSFGANLLAHELGHNLNLNHEFGPPNLMNPSISASFALTASQISTILISPLVQTDGAGKFITINPVAVMASAVPEPASWVLMLAGGAFIFGVARKRHAASGT